MILSLFKKSIVLVVELAAVLTDVLLPLAFEVDSLLNIKIIFLLIKAEIKYL